MLPPDEPVMVQGQAVQGAVGVGGSPGPGGPEAGSVAAVAVHTPLTSLHDPVLGTDVELTPELKLVVVVDVVVWYCSFCQPLTVWQVVVRPLLVPAEQLLLSSQPVSVVGQVTVGPEAGSEAVQEETFDAPESLVIWQVRRYPVLVEAVQDPELTKPVSVIWQVMVSPPVTEGVQDAA